MRFIAAWSPKTSDFVFIQRQKCFMLEPVCKTICFMPSSSQEKERDDVGLPSKTRSTYVGRCSYKRLSTWVFFSFWPAHSEPGRKYRSPLGPVGILPLVSTELELYPASKGERSLTVLARGEIQLIPYRPASKAGDPLQTRSWRLYA